MWLFYVTNFDLDDEAGIVTDIPFLFTKQLISNQLGKSSRVFFFKVKTLSGCSSTTIFSSLYQI